VPFPYYYRLSRADKAIYRESDSYDRIEIPDPRALRVPTKRLEEALLRDDRIDVERSAQRLLSDLCSQLNVDPVSVRVLDVRPSNAESELHGLYVREEERTPVIHVWMRTAAKKHVVSFRTFLRTLLHELCHHMDYELLELADSFHTEGFFQRESAMVRDIAGPGKSRRRPVTPGTEASGPAVEVERAEAASVDAPAKRKDPEQLKLF
jgi:hypothetical protein